ncbi:ABC transporter transmembrane domain-containing protein [Enterococcus faecalis]|uniref:ABC transporter transmembrane domain-containing protein n=1 Tax=Enterococcus faecalis TaxID=1351 RepID=UPI003D100933
MRKRRKIDESVAKEFSRVKYTQIAAIIFIIVRTILNLSIIFFIQKIVDQIVSDKVILDVKEIADISFLVIAYSLCIYISQYFLRLLFFTGNYSLINFLFSRLLNKSTEYFEKTSLGESISKITSDSTLISDWMAQGKVMLITQCFILVSSMCVLIYYSPIIFMVLAVLLVICFYTINKLSKKMGQFTKLDQVIKGNIYKKMTQTIMGIYDVKQFALESHFSSEVENDLFRTRLPISKKIAYFFSLYVGTSAFIAMVLPLIALLLASYLASIKMISVGAIIAIYSVSRMLDEPIRVISDQISNKNLAVHTQERVREIYEPEKIENFKGQEPLVPSLKTLDVEINQYKYPNSKQLVLKNVYFKLPKNSLYVIKGPSGAGKSTIGNLIMNQVSRANFEGNIRWNNLDIQNFHEKQYYKKANKMNQETLLFDGTIKENIVLFEYYSEEELVEVLNIVELEEFIQEHGVVLQSLKKSQTAPIFIGELKQP